jgi:hypothetical protein
MCDCFLSVQGRIDAISKGDLINEIEEQRTEIESLRRKLEGSQEAQATLIRDNSSLKEEINKALCAMNLIDKELVFERDRRMNAEGLLDRAYSADRCTITDEFPLKDKFYLTRLELSAWQTERQNAQSLWEKENNK